MSRGPHVRELFIGHDSSRFEPEDAKDKKSKLNAKGKSQLGGYKPKILSEDSSENIPVPTLSIETSQPQGQVNKAFIIGDKDVPMTLEPSENIYSEIGETSTRKTSDQEHSTTNPAFKDSPRSPVNDAKNKVGKSEVIDGVVIPAPDYDEEEVTVDFDDADLEFRRHSLYTEFVGEDFARYLDDDEEFYEFDKPRYSLPTTSPVSRKIKKSKTEAWRAVKPKKDSSKHMFRQNSKTSGKNTLRNFSVSDSKLAISFDGKENRKSLREGVPSNTSYEAFLHARNGTPFTADSSSNDSGHETGDDVVRNRGGNFWKKLTLKFKKSGYTLKQ